MDHAPIVATTDVKIVLPPPGVIREPDGALGAQCSYKLGVDPRMSFCIAGVFTLRGGAVASSGTGATRERVHRRGERIKLETFRAQRNQRVGDDQPRGEAIG